mgnify:CR=1 FL=1
MTDSPTAAEPHAVEAPLPVRRVSFYYPADTDPMWAPHLPEFAAAANAISLGMPYAEPLFIKAVRSTLFTAFSCRVQCSASTPSSSTV